MSSLYLFYISGPISISILQEVYIKENWGFLELRDSPNVTLLFCTLRYKVLTLFPNS